MSVRLNRELQLEMKDEKIENSCQPCIVLQSNNFITTLKGKYILRYKETFYINYFFKAREGFKRVVNVWQIFVKDVVLTSRCIEFCLLLGFYLIKVYSRSHKKNAKILTYRLR